MITDERIEELSPLFWAETNDPESEEWRDELTAEETALVEQWDRQVETGVYSLCKAILGREANNVADNRLA